MSARDARSSRPAGSGGRVAGPRRRAVLARLALGAVLALVLVSSFVPAVLRPPVAAAQGSPAAPPVPPAPEAPAAASAAPARTDTASYDLQARWDPAANQIHGAGVITYRNPSDDTLSRLWLKLYLNAFRDQNTLWMREAEGAHRGSSYDPRRPGWIRLERLRLLDTGEDLLGGSTEQTGTVLQVPLPTARAVRPGQTVRLEVAWTSQLPRVFARTGVAGDFVLAGQWYPKLAVYDRGAWDSEPWHANAEFFADFGSYTLTLTVPAGYLTGATGVRTASTVNGDGTMTVRYRAEAVSDVAWTAWPDYRLVTRPVQAAGRRVELELLAPRTLDAAADERYFRSAQAALDLLGRWFGPYPWPKLTLVVPPADAEGAGGMEYPMLVTLGLPTRGPFGLGRGVHGPEVVTVHEIAHQWVPLQVATNEAREAWLDEGFADYATIRVLDVLFSPERSLLDVGPLKFNYEAVQRMQYVLAAVHEPLDQPSWEYDSFLTYGATVYSKGSLAFRSLERISGEERFLAAMRGFFDRWRWRHPTTADLQRELEAELGQPLGWFFEPLVYGTGVVEYAVTRADAQGATVERRGNVAAPVEIAVTYRNGRVDRQRWDGAGERRDVVAQGGEIQRIEVDPEQTLRLEPDVLDNGRDVAPSPVPLTALAARLLGLLQAALLAGMLG